jgi:hypothetical protein
VIQNLSNIERTLYSSFISSAGPIYIRKWCHAINWCGPEMSVLLCVTTVVCFVMFRQ